MKKRHIRPHTGIGVNMHRIGGRLGSSCFGRDGVAIGIPPMFTQHAYIGCRSRLGGIATGTIEVAARIRMEAFVSC